jgi:ribosomal protein L7/L12
MELGTIAQLFRFGQKYEIDLSTPNAIEELIADVRILAGTIDPAINQAVAHIQLRGKVSAMSALEIAEAYASGSKLGAVKLMKEYGGLNLRDAKDIIDNCPDPR